MNNKVPHSLIPDMPSLLGWGGLIPFGLAALGTHSGVDTLVLYGFIGGTTYGAIILSFLGAVHWGLAMQDDRSQQTQYPTHVNDMLNQKLYPAYENLLKKKAF